MVNQTLEKKSSILALILLFALPSACVAQHSRHRHSKRHAAPVAVTVPALLLSDIHFDPYADPGKVVRLNAAPASAWAGILAEPDSPEISASAATLKAACPVRGTDTSAALWRSSLAALHTNAAQVRFATLSGDLLAHSFDCKYKTLLPQATPADYLSFTAKTVEYVLTSLHQALPGVGIYTALGNNDSGCSDYALNASNDGFLTLTAKVAAQVLPSDLSQADRDAFLHDFAALGDFNLPLSGVPNARLIALDDVFLSRSYKTCSGTPEAGPSVAQLDWLKQQLASAREQHQTVWFMGHIPPGVNLYATARNFTNVCTGAPAQMFLGSEQLADILSANADVVRLAIFGHTHADEMRFLPSQSAPIVVPPANSKVPSTASGVPLKIVASISPVNGNRPTFTLAKINPTTARLQDYTVYMASNLTGVDTTWSREYTYSTTYHQHSFDPTALNALVTNFQQDSGAKSPESQAYLRNYFPGDISSIIQIAWPEYACSLNHDSSAAFAACACAAAVPK